MLGQLIDFFCGILITFEYLNNSEKEKQGYRQTTILMKHIIFLLVLKISLNAVDINIVNPLLPCIIS